MTNIPTNPEKLMNSCLQGGLRSQNIFKTGTAELPLVSIVTVVFNGQLHLEQTILSVLGQSYSNIEYIVIDGGSSDGSLDIIQKYNNNIDYWISEPDDGIYHAMNKGIKLASGQFIGLINSDDYYTRDSVKIVVNYFNQFSVDCVFGDKLAVNEALGLQKVISVEPPVSLDQLSLHDVHPTVFVKSAIYRELSFNTKYRIASDYAFLLDVYERRYNFGKINIVLAVMRLGGVSSDFNIEAASIALKKIGLISSLKILMRKVLSASFHFFFSFNPGLSIYFYKLRGWTYLVK